MSYGHDQPLSGVAYCFESDADPHENYLKQILHLSSIVWKNEMNHKMKT